MSRRIRTAMAAGIAATALLFASAACSTSQSGSPSNGAAACGGLGSYQANGVTWRCTFDDEFSGAALDPSKWQVQTTAGSGFVTGPNTDRACYLNTPGNVAVAGGYLYLTARRAAYPFNCSGYPTQYSAGEVSTYGRFSQTYGRFEVRAKLPAATVAGLQETFWLWPTNDTRYGPEPSSGEIDFAEFFSVRPELVIPHVHYTPAGTDPDVTSLRCPLGDRDAFHDYTLQWEPGSLTMGVDGRTCLVDRWRPSAPLRAPEPFDRNFFLVLTQALGVNDNAFDPARTPLPATTVIDFVRVWQSSGR